MEVVLPLTGDIHDNCYAEAMNNRGQIVGQSDVQAGFWHAFLWDEEHGMVDLGSLGGSYSGAMDINDHGVAVGWSRTDSGGEAPFVWRDGVMTALRTLPGAELAGGDANAINNHGMIVGHSNGATSGVVHATLWDEQGNPSAIDDLGALASIAHDINDAGTIVGELVFEDGTRSAFIHLNGRTRDLNDLLPAGSSWTVDRAIAISNDGRIAGSGFAPNGDYRTFILEPVPLKAKLAG
jgi:probable HAF family extracellular repeat protein